ncbi:hypothetical protein NYZ99_13780 [Maribacter litopenaei]|uniref:DUF4625 domain-containing protein n=1 Tax=Maribacter litopenaei TaxID=2976127 RepID=A0ABY5Y7G9_9FLAO|nr:hypothetical protein [Maribacter litopenaei]UWX54095.1 hypothetical protein NYZ99_13780 [Maribacter litopenaei]
MKKVILVFAIFSTVLLSCTDRDDDVNMVNIRIKNDTEFNFNEVRVVEKDTVYENIASGGFSEYYEFESAPEEMGLTIISDSTTYNYTPRVLAIDSLPIGFYTYELGLDDENQIQFNFRIDY